MVELYASWAMQSIELHRSLDRNAAAIGHTFVPLKIDVTEGTEAAIQIQERYGARSAPTVVFVSTTGEEVGRIETLVDDRELSSVIAKASAGLQQ
jgi:thiol:disulfide interchange protein